jgi:hypothetical protein
MDAQALFDAVVDDFLHRHGGAERTQMMGMPCVKANGKLVAGFAPAEEAMVFKLRDAGVREQALALDGAHLFDPSRRGRPMTEWVAVPPAHAKQWPSFAEKALMSLAG